MEETKIQFDTAKLAKEKGFDLKVNSWYTLFHKQLIETNNKLDFNSFIVTKETTYHSSSYSAPTQSLLQKWLRKTYEIEVEVTRDIDWANEIHSETYNVSVCDIRLNFQSKENYYQGNIQSYEEALEIGLQEALNKIK